MADLEELYREIILDHYRSPRNRGELPSPPAHRVEGFNPLCGDEVVVTLLVVDGTLADIKIGGTGCSISQSSASLMSAAVKGKPLSDVQSLIRMFKGMMSIHQASLGDVGPEDRHPLDQDGHHPHEHGANGSSTAAGGSAAAGVSAAPTIGGAEVVDGEPEPVDPRQLGELAALQGVVKFPVRIKCATLSWNALAQGLTEIGAGQG